MSSRGIVDIQRALPVSDTIDRLESPLRAKGIKVFARIDQTAEARAVGLSMPQIGTPPMVNHPSIALDLPVKALAWESTDGKVRLSCNSPAYMMERHSLDSPPFQALEAILMAATQRL
jgi:uncharacterized protein (DUF302 family)